MIPSVASVLSALLFGSGVFFPSPHDKSGWALRVHNFSVQGPYLVGESISEIRIRITLSNSAKNTQAVAALTDAKAAGDLRLKIVEPEGTALNTISGRKVRGVPIAPNQLRTSESSTLESPLIAYGYWMVLSTGKYSVQAKLKIDGESIQSPQTTFDVVDVIGDAVLESRTIPLEGAELEPPEAQQVRPVIQQVRVGNRTLLIYRRFNGPAHKGSVQQTFRIAELPGKAVDFKVEGAFGDGNPLTITYRETTYTKWTTTHVINSVDGRPWTAAEEKHRQEKLKREAKLPADKK